MKKQCLILPVIVVFALVGLGSLASVRGSDIVVEIPGITILKDSEGDLQLRNCNVYHPDILCSLHPEAPLYLPGYFDIKSARITQIGRGLVDLVIKVYEAIPAVPPYPLVNYFWQFKGGCVNPQPENKAGITVHWNGTVWTANWYVITSCYPERTFDLGNPVPFKFIEDGVKVRVPLDELLTAADPGEPLVWHAGASRVPWKDYQPPDYPIFPFTTGVDYVPDVIELIPCFPPPGPCYWEPEDPTTWEPR